MSTVVTFSTLIAFGFFSAGCSTHFQPAAVEPPLPPAKTVPPLRVDPGPVPDDKGRVVLDAVDRPSDVQEILVTTEGHAYGPAGSASGHAETTRAVCQTPCAADLPRGAHRLRFTPVDRRGDWQEEFTVDVGTKPSVYRVAPGYTHEVPAGQIPAIVLEVLGFSAAATGGTLLLVNAISPDPDAKYAKPAAILTAAGAGTLAVGILLAYLTRGEKRPSAAVQWTPGLAAGGGSSVAVR